MIDINKKYKTEDGKEVRIYSVAGGGKYPVHGSFRQDSGFWSDYWVSTCWTDTGFQVEGILTSSDLVEVKPTYWVNVYPPARHFTREDADRAARRYRIACVEVKEGDGI